MATIILIKGEDITKNTIIGGNVDRDKYIADIKTCQNLYIRPLLGKELYDKICLDFSNDNLTGLYLTLYEDYIKDMVIQGSAEIYLIHSNLMVVNKGTEGDRVEWRLSADAKKLYKLYENEFYKWIETVSIPEYKKANTRTSIHGSWLLDRKKC